VLTSFVADAVLQIISGVAGGFKADAILKRLGITNQILVDAMLPQGCRRRNPVEELRFQATTVREMGFIGGGTKQTDLIAPCKATGPCLARVLALKRPLLRAGPD
jgi:hypothetical protein